MSLLFLSHSSANNAEALALRDWLVGEGWTDLFLDLDPENGIVAGERWERALHQAASRCDAVLFLISYQWLGSDWCRRELRLAQKLNKRIVALLIEDIPIESLPTELTESWQIVNLAAGADHGAAREVTLPWSGEVRYVYFSQFGLQRLRAGLQKAGLDPHTFPWLPASDPNRPPYRGLRPLEAEDAGIFFGRDAPIIELLAQLRGLRETAPPRFLAILGASGAGKSSFLRAGILPRLARDDRNYLPLPVVRPEQAVLSGQNGLLASLRAACQNAGLPITRKQLNDAISSGADALRPILRELASKAALPDWNGGEPQPPTLVLAVDQGEELFQADGSDEANTFLQLLGELLQSELPAVMAVFTIRSDSYDPLQSAEQLQGISQKTFSLPPMPRGAYQQVIEEPARLLARSSRPLKIEPLLTQALLRDIDQGGGKDALPLLAFTLERLYLDYGDDGDLRLDEYQDMGRIGGAIESAVERAIADAQRNPKVPSDREECLKLLRRGLIPWLAGIDPNTNLPRRKVARFSSVPEETRALIQHFIEHRLLSTDRDENNETTVEPAHEALLRQWAKLKGWLEDDAAALAALESVKAASRDWEANAKDPKWLVHQAGRLEDAETLHQRQDLAVNLDANDRNYLAECRKVEDERRDRELKQARELAEAQKRAVLRTRIGLAVASVLLVLAVLAGFKAREASTAARAQLDEASERAFGRAAEAIETGGADGYPAYLGEALGYAESMRVKAIAFLYLQQVGNSDTPHWLQHEGKVWSAQFSPDGRRIVTAGEDKTARLWDAQTGAPVGAPMRHEDTVYSAQFSPDGRRIVTASKDKTARLWDAETGVSIGVPMRHEGEVASAQFSPDGRRIVMASKDKTAHLWDAETGAPIGAPMRHEDTVRSAQFSPDGQRIVTASFDKTARLWDAETSAPIGTPMRHEGFVESAQFSPDGRWIVTVSKDKTARLWDAETGMSIGAPMRHEHDVASAQFSPDGRWIITRSSDAARLWNAPIDSGANSTQLRLALRAISGYEIGFDGRQQKLSTEELIAARATLQNEAIGNSPFDQLVRWRFADRSTRTISPFSKQNVPQFIENAINSALDLRLDTYRRLRADGLIKMPSWSEFSDLEEAYNLDPGHPLILLALLAALEQQPETVALWKDLTLKRITADSRLAAKAADMLKQQDDAGTARRAAQIALSLDANNALAKSVLEWANGKLH